jgi:hypothetical protein
MHALVEILLLDVGVRSKWTMPMRLLLHCARPRTVGKPIEWSPPKITGWRRREDMSHGTTDLMEALFEIGGDGEDVAGVAQRHLLAQIDAERMRRIPCGPNRGRGRRR